MHLPQTNGSFPTIQWVTSGTNLSDYRPAIAADGQTVVFERTLFDPDAPVSLYLAVIGGPDPQPFLPDLDGAQTRPDWCWTTNQIAFNLGLNVWTVNADGSGAAAIPNTQGFIYPQWNAAGNLLVVMNNNAQSANPNPCSSAIDTGGTMTIANLNGADANNTAVFGGMPAVSPSNSNSIAFAGQPVLPTWNPPSSPPYNQDNNYIFLNSGSSPFTSNPMESAASITQFESQFQGRAPAWSPDGRYIVFESTRTSGQMALYLFDTQNPANAPVQLTDTVYGAQHAKFFPNGSQLIFCARPNPQSRFRIASIDISSYLAS